MMDWTPEEVALIVRDYFEMFKFENEHLKYSKADHRRSLRPLLNDRSEGSIEFKHQNISAVLANMGLPYIRGYKPRFNYQKQLLEKEVADFIVKNKVPFEQFFKRFSDEAVSLKAKVDFDSIVDQDPPEGSEVKDDEPLYRPIKINYLEREQNNRELGERGEDLVIQFEKWRLIKAGRENLADRIEWVSKEKGDGTGYDILSKNDNGTDRYIEVKTTKLSKETPIYLTRTEISFASRNADDFFLYRVFNFASNPQFFIRQGEYQRFCKLQPVAFRGYF